jgi:dTDP-glucose 4,6-dehydratase
MSGTAVCADNCKAIDAVLRKGNLGEVYNIGANNEVKNIDVAEAIVGLLGKAKDLITFVEDRLGHDRRYALDCAKLRSLGWEAETPFNEGLAATVKWYVDNPEWWKKIREKSKEFQSFYDSYYKKRT